MKLPYDLVMVLWDDPGELGLGWQGDKDIDPKPMLGRNVGFLIKRTKDYFVLSGLISDPDTTPAEFMSHHAHFQIARSLVKELYVIGKKGTEFPTSKAKDEHPTA